MKRKILGYSLFLFLGLTVLVQVSFGVIRAEEISPDFPIQVFAHPDATTTIIFPFDVNSAQGVGFIDREVLDSMDEKELGQIAFDFVYYFQSPRMLTLFPVVPETPYRNLNIFTSDDMWVVQPIYTPNPDEADAKLTLLLPEEPQDKQFTRYEDRVMSPHAKGSLKEEEQPITQIERSTTPASHQSEGLLNKDQLVGFLQLTQLASTLEVATLNELRKERPNFDFREIEQPTILNSGDLEATLYLVVRDRKTDTNGFYGVLRNKTSQPMRIDRNSLAVRVGNERYHSVVNDMDEFIEPNESIPMWFVTYRSGVMRGNVDVANDFRVILTVTPQ